VALVGLGVSLGILFAVRRGFFRQWLSTATSLFDVTLVSGVLAMCIVLGFPEVAVNSRIVYEIYLLVLASTCLRYDFAGPLSSPGSWPRSSTPRSCWSSTRAGISTDPVFAARGYGTFSWSDQVARIALLPTAAALSWAILRRTEWLRRLSTHDALTGLLNRNVLEERIAEEVIRARRYKRSLSIAMVDLDFFKAFNDSYGHASGDVALRLLAQTLRRTVRRTDIVARIGGEEFVIVLPETPNGDAALKMEQIRREVEALTIDLPRATGAHITLSAGVASLSAEKDEAADILQRADDLLLAAKRADGIASWEDKGIMARATAAAV